MLPAGPQALRWRPPPPATLSWESIAHPTWKAKLPPKVSEGVVLIHFCILLHAVAVVVVEGKAIGAAVAAVGAEEHVKGVGAPEERSKGRVGVSVESVVVR